MFDIVPFMFLPSKFYISKENEYILELREKKLRLYIGCIILISMGMLYFSIPIFVKPSNNHDSDYWSKIFIFIVGGIHVYLGFIPLIFPGKIFLNKKERLVKFMTGYRRFIFRPLIVPFSQVSHISIEEYYSGRGVAGLYWDKIILKRNNKSDIKIDHSRDDIYLNKISKKLSDFLDCKVFYQSH